MFSFHRASRAPIFMFRNPARPCFNYGAVTATVCNTIGRQVPSWRPGTKAFNICWSNQRHRIFVFLFLQHRREADVATAWTSGPVTGGCWTAFSSCRQQPQLQGSHRWRNIVTLSQLYKGDPETRTTDTEWDLPSNASIKSYPIKTSSSHSPNPVSSLSAPSP